MGDWFNEAARPALDWWAVIVAGLAGFGIGGLWYSPVLFAKPWMKENGFTEEQIGKDDMAPIMGGAVALTVLCAYSIARLLVRGGGWEAGAKTGLLVGAAVACALAIGYLFERKSLNLWLINAGHWLVSFVAMGAIIGAWG